MKLFETSEFEIVYDDMLKQFPENERNSRQGFYEAVKKKGYKAYLAMDGDTNAGYVVLYFDEGNKTLWLDYIAVFEEFHCCGYGKMIFEAMKNSFPGFIGCWLEVEKPDENVPNTIRRVNFYEKLGAFKTKCNYFYPNRTGSIPLDLYFLPFSEGFAFSDDFCAKCVKTVFKAVHCDKPHTKDVFDKITFED